MMFLHMDCSSKRQENSELTLCQPYNNLCQTALDYVDDAAGSGLSLGSK